MSMPYMVSPVPKYFCQMPMLPPDCKSVHTSSFLQIRSRPGSAAQAAAVLCAWDAVRTWGAALAKCHERAVMCQIRTRVDCLLVRMPHLYADLQEVELPPTEALEVPAASEAGI
jgi:hypothetical protein